MSDDVGLLDKHIEVLRSGGILPEKDVVALCTRVSGGRSRRLALLGLAFLQISALLADPLLAR
jgi:hypothetical protein